MPGSKHGPTIKDSDQYEALREEGMSKEKAARISNASASQGRSTVGRRGGTAEDYDERTKDELLDCPPRVHARRSKTRRRWRRRSAQEPFSAQTITRRARTNGGAGDCALPGFAQCRPGIAEYSDDGADIQRPGSDGEPRSSFRRDGDSSAARGAVVDHTPCARENPRDICGLRAFSAESCLNSTAGEAQIHSAGRQMVPRL